MLETNLLLQIGENNLGGKRGNEFKTKCVQDVVTLTLQFRLLKAVVHSVPQNVLEGADYYGAHL